jgi:hypothetical protein
MYLGTATDGTFYISETSGTARVTVQQGGNVGIGTTNPLNLLHVSQPSANTIFRLGNNTSYDQFIYFNGNNDWSLGMDYSNSNAFVLSNSSTIGTNDRVVVTTAGNIGIGTTSPSQRLHVAGRALVDQFQYTKAIDYSSGDLDSLTLAGFYDGSGMTNAPNSGWFYVTVEKHSDGSTGWIHQTATSFGAGNTPNEVYTRVRVGITWGAWKQLGDAASISGTTNYVSKFTSANSIGNSLLYDNGTNVGIGTTSPTDKLTLKSPGEVGSYGDGFVFQRNANTAKLVRIYESSADGFLEVRDGGNTIVSKLSGYTGTPSFFLSNVGIGTSSPGARLTVQTSTASSADSFRITDGTGVINIGHWDTITNRFEFSGKPTYFIQYGTGNYISFGTLGSENMRIDAGGNVGIGTSSPSEALVVNRSGVNSFVCAFTDTGQSGIKLLAGTGSTNRATRIDFLNGVSSGTTPRWTLLNDYNQNGTNDFRFVNSDTSTSVLTLLQSGNVGIGTTSPSHPLSVQANSGANAIAIYGRSSDNTGSLDFFQNNGTTRLMEIGISPSAAEFYYDANSPMIFYTNATERMRITSGGNVGIGTTSPAERLDVFGRIQARPSANGSVGNNWYMIGSITDATNYGVANGIEVENAGINSYAMTFGTQNTYLTGITEKMRITSGGNLLVGTQINYSRLTVSNGSATRSGITISDTSSASLMMFAGASQPASISFDTYGLRFVGGSTVGTDNGSEFMRITTGGNVGIGTTSPVVKLHVIGDIGVGNSYNGGVYASAGASSADLNWGFDFLNTSGLDDYSTRVKFYPSSGSTRKLGFWNSQLNSYMAYFDGSLNTPNFIVNAGNVGIGTTSPTYKLDVVGDIRLPENNYLYFGNTSNFIRRDSSNILTVAGFSSVYLTTFGSTRVAVVGSGDVGIGTTSPDVKLHVVGTSFVPTTMKLVHSQAFGTPQTLSLSSNSTGVSSLDLSFANPFAINIGGSEKMRIAANGSVGVGTTAPDTSSIMDLSSRRQGFLPPRMTNSEMNSIGSPATGLIVYDTTNNKVTVYNGSSWVPLH